MKKSTKYALLFCIMFAIIGFVLGRSILFPIQKEPFYEKDAEVNTDDQELLTEAESTLDDGKLKATSYVSFEYKQINLELATNLFLQGSVEITESTERIKCVDEMGSYLFLQGSNLSSLLKTSESSYLYQYALSTELMGVLDEQYLNCEDFSSQINTQCSFANSEDVYADFDKVMQELVGYSLNEESEIVGLSKEYLSHCADFHKAEFVELAEENEKAREIYDYLFATQDFDRDLSECYVIIGCFDIEGIPINNQSFAFVELSENQFNFSVAPSVIAIINDSGIIALQIDGAFEKLEESDVADLISAEDAKEILQAIPQTNETAMFLQEENPTLEYVAQSTVSGEHYFRLCWCFSDPTSLVGKQLYIDASTGDVFL